MNKVHKFTINDEPFVDVSTGKRQATLVYKGGRYVYAEICTETGKIQAPVHTSDEPEMETALERLTLMDTRKIIEIDANINPIAAAIILDSFYTLEIPNYEEVLPSGQTYTHEYSDTAKLGDIYKITDLIFDLEKNDFDYTYDINNVSDQDFVQSIDAQLEYIQQQLTENTYSDAQMNEIDAFKQELLDLKAAYDGSVKHWKVGFPSCSVL